MTHTLTLHKLQVLYRLRHHRPGGLQEVQGEAGEGGAEDCQDHTQPLQVTDKLKSILQAPGS